MIAALKGAARDCCYLLCDDAFIERYGLGMVRPKRIGLRAALGDGYLASGGSLDELARKIDVPATTLSATVGRHNGFADSGVDAEFAKGQDAYQRNLGDPNHGPNPCIGKMARPPFYALRIYPGDIGTSVGLATDDKARVIGANGEPVRGLYACGNDMESIMSGHYPGPGITLGPAMTFGYIAARHAHEAIGLSRDEDRGDNK
jgi:succinate dehydrogenase/fumarate reductase flavoprotein subunit